MKIRTKVSMIVLACWILMMGAVYLGSQFIIKQSFLNLEDQSATNDLARIQQTIQQMESSVGSVLGSWAIWDDTYKFMTDKNKPYIDSNLKINSFTSSNVDMVLYFDTAGRPFYSAVADGERKKLMPLPDGLAQYLSPQSKIIYQPTVDSGMTGLVSIPSGILMVAAHSIVTSNQTGPIHGTLVMARYFSATSLMKLRSITKVKTFIYPLDQIKQNPRLLNDFNQLKNSSYLLIRSSEKTLNAYGLLKDINNQPIALIEAQLPRDIYEAGVSTIHYYNVLAIVMMITMLLLFWGSIHSIVIRRIEKLRSNIISAEPNPDVLRSLSKETSDEVSSVAILYHHATHDSLTGLGNRHLIHQAFQNRHTSVTGENKIALIFIDVDNFKYVNDTLGHEVGDALLKHIAKQLNASLRNGDLAIRLGGDEFVVMLFYIHPKILDTILTRLFNLIRNDVVINSHEINITCSMGISLYPDNGNSVQTLLKHADIALYHAKELGKNQYQFYSNKLTIAIQEATKKELELQGAIDNKELCLYYQPIYDVTTREMTSIEALIRWNHPTRGLLPAGEIIPLAEKSGLIIPIGKWVLKTACRQLKTWINQGIVNVPVAVNLSLLQIKSLSINKLVNETLAETDLDPHFLELELTETSYIELNESILSELYLLKERGISLAVDDFGVGYSGLAYLRSLPIDKLKIDQSFVRDMFTDIDDRAITLAIIAIAHQLNLKVIAEGVETKDQYEFLKNNNVDAVQGNYFCTPLSVEDFEKRGELKELV